MCLALAAVAHSYETVVPWPSLTWPGKRHVVAGTLKMSSQA